MQRTQIDPDVLTEKFLENLAKILDLLPAIQLLQNSDATDHHQPFLDGQPPAFLFVHQRHIGGHLFGQKNRADLTRAQAGL